MFSELDADQVEALGRISRSVIEVLDAACATSDEACDEQCS
jgi:hypothetical protein